MTTVLRRPNTVLPARRGGWLAASLGLALGDPGYRLVMDES